jgi:hypothetical protein
MSYCVNVNICLPSRSVAFGDIVTPSDQQVQRNVSRILVNLHAAQTVEGAGRLRSVYERSVKFEPTAIAVQTQAGTDDRDVHRMVVR